MNFVSIWEYNEDNPVGLRTGLMLKNIATIDEIDCLINLVDGRVIETDPQSIDKVKDALNYKKQQGE